MRRSPMHAAHAPLLRAARGSGRAGAGRPRPSSAPAPAPRCRQAAQPGAQRRAFAGVAGLAQQLSASRDCGVGRGIRRAVVHDQHALDVSARAADDVTRSSWRSCRPEPGRPRTGVGYLLSGLRVDGAHSPQRQVSTPRALAAPSTARRIALPGVIAAFFSGRVIAKFSGDLLHSRNQPRRHRVAL